MTLDCFWCMCKRTISPATMLKAHIRLQKCLRLCATIMLCNYANPFNTRSGCMCVMHLCCYEAKQPNLKLKTHLKQLLGSLPLAFTLPSLVLCLWVRPGDYHRLKVLCYGQTLELISIICEFQT